MIIPTGTDAPIYHWPWATVALILLNVACFVAAPPVIHRPNPEADEAEAAAPVEPTPYQKYALALGDGLHPVQWVTHNFLHGGVGHLVGNLIFLWAFGIVVEGKLGALKFVPLYLAIGTLHGALTQILLLRSGLDGHAVGASAVVFGLLAICMVWAPRNELNCLAIFLVGMRVSVFHWDLRYTTVALFYLAEQVVGLIWGGVTGRAVVSELGHLSGAFWGCLLGAGMVKARLVDCEGWDIFSLLSKNRKLSQDWKKRGESLDRQQRSDRVRAVKRDADQAEKSPEERAAAAVRKVRKLIDAGDFAGAVAAYDKAARTLAQWPSQPDLLELIKAMHAARAEADSIRLMRDYCRYYPESASRIRLKLAHVLIRDRQRPAAALKVLAEIAPGSLPPDLETTRGKLARQAAHMQEEGVLELEGDE